MHHRVLPLLLPFPLLGVPSACQDQDDGAAPPYRLHDAFPEQARFDRPLYLDHTAADPGFVYVVEQYGKVWRMPLDRGGKERKLFLDWTEKTRHPRNGGHNEEGLLGFAFDPAYADNAFVYIYYSTPPGGNKQRSVISRLRVQSVDGVQGGEPMPMVDNASELVLMEIEQPFGNHDGGTILFGPDRMLYVALGDGGAANDPFGHGQNLGTLLGSVLRIDVRDATAERPYRIPDDNPFVGQDGVCGEIWCYGLRNPWRISFDRKTGDLWCGDVGQNDWEEVDRLVKGGNYGWNLMEAHVPFRGKPVPDDVRADLVPPVAYYPRPDGYSVTGGYVYRGRRHADLVGRYVYADFVTGFVWAVREDRAGGSHEVSLIADATVRRPIASFAELPDGELLLLAFDGRLYELTR